MREKEQAIRNLTTALRDSNNRYKDFNDKHEILESNYKDLVVKHKNLESNYKDLDSKYKNLESNYEDIKVKYKKMDEILQNIQLIILQESSEASKINQVISELNVKS